MSYQGMVELGEDIPIWTRTKNTSGVPTAPTGNVTYKVYDADGSVVGSQSGNMTGPVDSNTGLFRVVLTASAANSYGRGSYLVVMEATVSSNAWSDRAFFTVT